MQSLFCDDIDGLMTSWEALLRDLPGLKKELLEELGAAALETVGQNITAAGMRDGGARIRSYQKYHVGSKHGYVAVRAVGSGEGAETGPNGPGALTNYTENGHAIRKPGASSHRYRPRIKVARVDGYHYYAQATEPALQRGMEAVDAFAREVARRMEGSQ